MLIASLTIFSKLSRQEFERCNGAVEVGDTREAGVNETTTEEEP